MAWYLGGMSDTTSKPRKTQIVVVGGGAGGLEPYSGTQPDAPCHI